MIRSSPKKAPVKKKIPKIAEVKRAITIGGTIAAVAIAGIVIGVVFISNHKPKEKILVVSITEEYSFNDPLNGRQALINAQIAETLFENEYTSDGSQIVSNLITSWKWSDNATELTCYLREGVQFHDGAPFNATAVKWNFDRMHRIIDPSDPDAFLFSTLFFLIDGRWIVNNTQIIDNYTVKFVLNAPFIPFQQFLTHYTTSIVSPKSTPFNNTLSVETGVLVGTGPFKFGTYNPGDNITLLSNMEYWDRDQPKVNKLVFSIYNSLKDLKNSFLAKEIHYLWGVSLSVLNITLDTIINDPGYTVNELLPITCQWMAVDNSVINLTMRKAISYAINYSYILEEINKWSGDSYIRFRSPIPEGVLYSNTTAFEVPYYNISKARQFLIEGGWPRTENLTANEDISPGNDWERLVTDGTPLANYTLQRWNARGFWINSTFDPIPDYLKQIGIKVKLLPYYNITDMFILGWIYDYNDPHNDIFLDYHSEWNWINLNDSLIDQWIEIGVKETNPVIRKQIYYNIQERLIEKIYPNIWTTHRTNYVVYVSNLKGLQLNPFKTLFKTVYFD